MNIFESVILSFALAMDCFSIGITCGMIEKRFHASQAFAMALLFGVFQAGMPLIGWGASAVFYKYIESFAPIIAFVMLTFIGGKMIWESLRHEEGKTFDPEKPATLLYLAVATSIDALAIGITFTCIGLESVKDIAVPLLVIAAGSFCFTLLGKWLGAFAGRKFEFNAELIGGAVLIILGIKTLVVG